MANIGLFKHTRYGYEGMITTLSLCLNARFVPNRKKKTDTSPDFFIKAGDSDLGVAWKATSKGRREKKRRITLNAFWMIQVFQTQFKQRFSITPMALIWSGIDQVKIDQNCQSVLCLKRPILKSNSVD